MTASTPTSVRGLRSAGPVICSSGRYMVGIPPPPVQITTTPLSSSVRIGPISKMRRGTGEGTTRRHPAPSGLTVQPRSAASWWASASEYTGPTNFVGSAIAGSSGSTSTIVRTVASCLSNGSRLPSSCSIR